LGGTDEVEVYETSAGNSRWRLNASNGQEVANSGENFASHSNAKRAAESFKANAKKSIFEVYSSSDQHRWRAKASNGQITASSGEPFVSESNAQRAADNVRDNAGSAEGP
jgi:uncharacterized protein YegP (UPF0339 family)